MGATRGVFPFWLHSVMHTEPFLKRKGVGRHGGNLATQEPECVGVARRMPPVAPVALVILVVLVVLVVHIETRLHKGLNVLELQDACPQ
jgi:hypothetical protein